MKRKQTRRQRKSRRQSRKQLKSRRSNRRSRLFHGGANLPVPEGSVVAVDLDPKDPYSVPVFMNKGKFEEEIVED